jgi:hypothetical protein
LSPAAFDALFRRKQEAERRAFLRSGIIAAAIYNANPFRGQDAKPVSPLEFVPGERPESRQTLAEQIAAVTAAFKCGPGKRKRV